MFPLDPSKLDPKTLMELTHLVRQLPPEQLNKMQSLMHNMMAGIDVTKDMENFEKTLPTGFREKLVAIMSQAPAPSVSTPAVTVEPKDMNVTEARLTVLRAVQAGGLSPEEAEKLLFQD